MCSALTTFQTTFPGAPFAAQAGSRDLAQRLPGRARGAGLEMLKFQQRKPGDFGTVSHMWPGKSCLQERSRSKFHDEPVSQMHPEIVGSILHGSDASLITT